MGVDIHRAQHTLLAHNQGQGYHAVHAQPADLGAEPRPCSVTAQGPRAHGVALRGRGNAGPLAEAVLDRVHRTHEIGGGDDRVRPPVLEQRQTGAVGTGDGVDGEFRHMGEHVRQIELADGQMGQALEAVSEVGLVCGHREPPTWRVSRAPSVTRGSGRELLSLDVDSSRIRRAQRPSKVVQTTAAPPGRSRPATSRSRRWRARWQIRADQSLGRAQARPTACSGTGDARSGSSARPAGSR